MRDEIKTQPFKPASGDVKDRVGASAEERIYSKGWKEDGFGEYQCLVCGKTTPHEMQERRWWKALFGSADAAFVSGIVPWAAVLLLAAVSMGILGVILLFFLRPVLQIGSLVLGEAIFPTPRRCVICKAPATLAQARSSQMQPAQPAQATSPVPQSEADMPR